MSAGEGKRAGRALLPISGVQIPRDYLSRAVAWELHWGRQEEQVLSAGCGLLPGFSSRASITWPGLRMSSVAWTAAMQDRPVKQACNSAGLLGLADA